MRRWRSFGNYVAVWDMRLVRYLLSALAIIGTITVVVIGAVYYYSEPSQRKSLEQEYTRMQSVVEFDSIATWALQCMKVKKLDELPLWHQELLSYYRPNDTDTSDLPPGVRDLFNEQKAILILNRTLSFERENYNLLAQREYTVWEVLTLLTILVGTLTTIFVSISSTEFGRGDGTAQKLIRVLAIIFPVLGTALAGIIGFYTPQAKWNQASRTLASLTQLHAQMAVDIWKLKCIETPDDENAKGAERMLNDWSKRYVDIQTVSAAAGPSASTSGSGAAPK